MKTLYAVAMGARRGDVISTKPGAVVRDSYEAAMGGASMMAQDEFPTHDGYTGHFAVIAEIPDYILDMVRPTEGHDE